MAKHKKGANKRNATTEEDKLSQNGTDKRASQKIHGNIQKSHVQAAAKNKQQTSDHQLKKKVRSVGGNEKSSAQFWLILSLLGVSVAVGGVVFINEIQDVAENTFRLYIQPQVPVFQRMIGLDSETINDMQQDESSYTSEKETEENSLPQTSLSSDHSKNTDVDIDVEVLNLSPSQTDNRQTKLDVDNTETDQDVPVSNINQPEVVDKKTSHHEVDDKRTSHHEVDDKRTSTQEVDDKRTSHHEVDDKRTSPHEVDDKRTSFHEVDDKRTSFHEVDDKRTSTQEVDDKRTSTQEVDDKRTSPQDVDDKRTSHQEVDDKRTSTQEVDDKRTSTQEVDDKRTSHQEVDDKRTSHQEVDDKRTSHHEVDDKRTSTQEVDDKRTSPQEVDDKRTSTQEVDDKRTSHQEVDDKRTSTQEVDDKRTSTQEVDDKRTSHQEVDDKRTSHQEVDDKRTSHHEVDDKRTSTQEVDDKRTSPQEVDDKRTSTQEVDDKRMSTQEADDKRTSTQEVDDKRTSTQEVDDKRTSTQEVDDKRTSHQEVDDKRTSPQEVDDKRTSTQEVNDKRTSTQEVNDKRTSTQEVDNKRTSTEEVNDKRTSTQEVDDKRTSTQEVNDKRTSPQEVDDKRTSHQEVDDKRTSPQEVDDKRTSPHEVDVTHDTSINTEEQVLQSLSKDITSPSKEVSQDEDSSKNTVHIESEEQKDLEVHVPAKETVKEQLEEKSSRDKTSAEDLRDVEKMDAVTQPKIPNRTEYVKSSVTNDEDLTISNELDEADELLENDKLEKAIEKYDTILREHPLSPRAHYGKGLTLDKLGFKYMSNDNLERAIDFLAAVLQLNNVPEELFKLAGRKLADRQQFRGWGGQAVKTFKTLVQRFPEDLALKNELGVSYLMIGRNDRARDVFKEVLVTDSANGFAQAHLGFILKTQDNDLERAVELLAKGIKSGAPGTVDGRFYLHLGDSLLRLGRESEARKYFQEGEEKGLFLSAWQRSLYNVDRLTGRPWWSAEQTPYQEYLKMLQDNWKVIRDEGLAQLNAKTGSFLPEEENLRDTGDWKQFTLYQQGRKKAENCAKVPETCKLIDKIPDASGCKRGQVKFSVMSPGIHVWPHVGPTNCRIRAHLGLVVPEGPIIRVMKETRTWKEGEFIIFDDSFEHEVWHEGSELRLVLIVDFWHPELTEAEKRRLSAI